MSATRDAVATLARGETLSVDQAQAAFDELMAGDTAEAVIGAFLMGLIGQGERAQDIIAGARALRARVTPASVPVGLQARLVDTCGTGGDGHDTFNISTAAAIIAAGAGVPIAKHGGRASSSQSGSAEVLRELGVNLEAPPGAAARALETAGVAFLFAPAHHAAMRHVAPARKALGLRTIFNLIGPLTNPAAAKRQVLGVSRADLAPVMAQALRDLGAVRAWVVHGRDGLDELTTTRESLVVSLQDGAITTFEVTPEAVGLPRVDLAQLKGGPPEENAVALRAVLVGASGPFRDIALLNAAAALVVGDAAASLKEGVERAAKAIDSGAAAQALEQLVIASTGAAADDGDG